MKSTFTTVCYLIIVISFYNTSASQENERLGTKLYPNIEVAGLYNINKGDIFKSDNNKKLSAYNSGGFSLGLGLTLFKPKQSGIMFSVSAGYKSNNENFVTKPGADESDIHYKHTIGAIYLRPEASFYFRVMEKNFINFGLYTEPNVVLKETMPQYRLNYNKSTLSSYNTLTSTTYYHWGKNKESGNSLVIPFNLLGFSAGFTQINSGAVIKMIKCRLFLEFDPKMALGNNPYSAMNNRSSANIKYYEDNATNRNVISTDYYIDKMMRLGVGIAVGM